MDRIQFIHSPRENPATSALAITASCALHTLTLGSLLGLTFYYHSHPPPSQTGSAAGTPTIILEAVIIAPEEPRPLPAPALTPPTRPSKPTLAKTEMLHHMPTPNSAMSATIAAQDDRNANQSRP